MAGKTVIIASNNAHKISEIRSALSFPGWSFVSLREAGVESRPDENADSFEGNARIKAQAVRAVRPDCAVLADDSGLEVDYLNGAPGVYSSRYGGVEGDDARNNAKLLRALSDVPEQDRSARFVCTLVFIDEDGTETVARGVVEGRIACAPTGDEGFGYDPLFLPAAFDYQKSFAQISQAEKNELSHRGRALRLLKHEVATG